MNDQLTDITLVIDRSGSMEAIRSDAEGGVNTFIEQQRGEEGDALLTLIQFDTEYEFVENGTPIDKVERYTLVPRGATALYDAVGRGIVETGERLAKLPEADRPGLVVFVIVTDGAENSSVEYDRERVKQMIEHQQSKYGWQFTFLAANQDAFAAGGGMGIGSGGIAHFAASKVQASHAAASANVARMRKAKAMGQAVRNEYTEEERQSME